MIRFFYVPFRHADVSRWDAWYFPCFVWDCVHAVKLRSKNCFSSITSRILTIVFFCSLVDKRDLLIQYPNAGDIIKKLPASSSAGCKCFKPEAHLVIEKFLSLKTENSRFHFTANMVHHTRARREVSSNWNFRGIAQGLFISILNHFFSPVPQRPLPRMSMVVESGRLVCVPLGDVRVHVDVVKIRNTSHWTLPDRDTSNEQRATSDHQTILP